MLKMYRMTTSIYYEWRQFFFFFLLFYFLERFDIYLFINQTNINKSLRFREHVKSKGNELNNIRLLKYCQYEHNKINT